MVYCIFPYLWLRGKQKHAVSVLVCVLPSVTHTHSFLRSPRFAYQGRYSRHVVISYTPVLHILWIRSVFSIPSWIFFFFFFSPPPVPYVTVLRTDQDSVERKARDFSSLVPKTRREGEIFSSLFTFYFCFVFCSCIVGFCFLCLYTTVCPYGHTE